MRPADMPPAERFEHGTRARYTSGCRCSDCRRANTEAAKRRRLEARERSSEAKPSGPPGAGVLVRGGHEHRIRTCPGANGAACVRTPAAWLRIRDVCRACIERVTVWNGAVPVAEARAHLRKLSHSGVGIHSVADAGSLGSSTLEKVRRGKGTIRAKTLVRVLEVDAGAKADHALVPAGATLTLLRSLLDEGYTEADLAGRLGYKDGRLQQLRRKRVLACTALRIERLHRSLML